MNSENGKTFDPRRLVIDFSSKINLKGSNKYVALSNLSIYYTQKNKKTTYKNNKFKISAPAWNDKFELPDGSTSISDKYTCICKQNRKYIRIKFEIESEYYLELLTPENIKLLRSTENK